ncbi:hypothetical protein DVH24_015411 [Malus domestica]|uniref:Uncharacterized protein n=1 Tax=Malus domestica TaxID=3750 RepID=A0A498KQC5_MALDO|nr:hypothetical protein DVH24_015411 [Malus domestica]
MRQMARQLQLKLAASKQKMVLILRKQEMGYPVKHLLLILFFNHSEKHAVFHFPEESLFLG